MVTEWRRALEAHPGNIAVARGAARLIALHSPQEGRAVLEHVIESSPGDADLWLDFARISQDPRQRLRAFERARALGSAESEPARLDRPCGGAGRRARRRRRGVQRADTAARRGPPAAWRCARLAGVGARALGAGPGTHRRRRRGAAADPGHLRPQSPHPLGAHRARDDCRRPWRHRRCRRAPARRGPGAARLPPARPRAGARPGAQASRSGSRHRRGRGPASWGRPSGTTTAFAPGSNRRSAARSPAAPERAYGGAGVAGGGPLSRRVRRPPTMIGAWRDRRRSMTARVNVPTIPPSTSSDERLT